MSLVKRAMTQTRAMGFQNGSKPAGPVAKTQPPSSVKLPVQVMRQRLAQRYGGGPAKVTPTLGRS